MKYYLAIDIGASSGRHILGHLQNGKLVLEEIYRFFNGPKQTQSGLVWDIDGLFREILTGLKKAEELQKIPSYIGIDTWAVDYVLLDKADQKIGESFCYRDERGAKAAKAVHGLIPFDALYANTGIQFQPFNTIYQLYADKESGKLENAETFLMLPDYFNFLLTGIKMQEYTNTTSTGLVNAESHTWDQGILKQLALPEKLFKPIMQPGCIVGRLSRAVQEKIGYDAQVLLPATHDTASAVVAAPLEKESVYISSGTWSLLGVERQSARTDEKSRAYNYSNEGSPDLKFRLQKNIMGLWMIQEVRRELGAKYSFSELAKLAEKEPVDICLNTFDSAFLAPESMCGEIYKAAGRALSVGQTAYCVFNSLAKSYALSIGELEKLTGMLIKTINIIGGGCQNQLLNRLTAIQTGKQVITGPVESTAIGNIIMQMIGAGELVSIDAGRELVKRSFDIQEV